MKCWNPECGVYSADEYCIATLVNPCEDVRDIEYTEDMDCEDSKQSESATLATWCMTCRKITYDPNWVKMVLGFLSPAHQGLEPLILPKERNGNDLDAANL